MPEYWSVRWRRFLPIAVAVVGGCFSSRGPYLGPGEDTGPNRGTDSISTLVSCPAVGDSTDHFTDPMYLTNYGGVSIDTVTLFFRGAQGSYPVILNVQQGDFAGNLVGSDTQRVSLDSTRNYPVHFAIGGGYGALKGSTLIFRIVLPVGRHLFYGIQSGPGCPVTEANFPSLLPEDIRRQGVVIEIKGRAQ